MDNQQEMNKVVYIDETTDSPQQPSEQSIQTTDQLLFGNNVPVIDNEKENILVNENDTIVNNNVDDDDVNEFDYDDVQSGGYESETSSVSTNQILSIDPLYLRLTKFLQTDDGTSVAQTLTNIHKELVSLNSTLNKTSIN